MWSWFPNLSLLPLYPFLCFNDWYSRAILVLNHVYQASLIHNFIVRHHSLVHEGFHQGWGKFEGHLIEFSRYLNVLCMISGEIWIALVKFMEFKSLWSVLHVISVETELTSSKLYLRDVLGIAEDSLEQDCGDFTGMFWLRSRLK